MTLGEIKIEALKLMCYELSSENAENIEALRGEAHYRELLDKMPGSINRCFSELEGRGFLSSMCFELDSAPAVSSGAVRSGYIRYSLDDIPGAVELDRVIHETADGIYDGDFPYRREGRVIVLPLLKEGELYRLLYKGRLERVSNDTENEAIIGVPEHIAALIPYYIKGELFREDEPDEAAEARNLFEQALYSFAVPEESRQSEVEAVYSMRYE